MNLKSYSELIKLISYEDRFRYLLLKGVVGEETFGAQRYLNQRFYKSDEWKAIRNSIILRDEGCDLGVKGYDIIGLIIVHHIVPITIKDIYTRSALLLNPENMICVSDATHKAIHYGNDLYLQTQYHERTKYDTCPWKL